MHHASWAKSPHTWCLACFLQALLTFSPVLAQFHSHHISGHSNETVDILSQPSCTVSWESIIKLWPIDLHSCRPYLVPCTLLSTLHGCINSNGIETTLAGKIALSTHATHFATWLEHMGYNDQTIRLICKADGIMLLERYLHDITTWPAARLESHTITLQGSTLLLYFKAASLWLHVELGVEVPTMNPMTQNIVQPFQDCSSPQMGYAKTQMQTVHPSDVWNIQGSSTDPPPSKLAKPQHVTIPGCFWLGLPWPLHVQLMHQILSTIDQRTWCQLDPTWYHCQSTCRQTPSIYLVWFPLPIGNWHFDLGSRCPGQAYQGHWAPDTLLFWWKPH